MLLSVFTRHSTGCKFSRDRACRRCNCPKWVGGQINGYYFRQSAKTHQWAEAEAVRLELEEALAKGLPPFGPAVVAGEESSVPATTPPPVPSVAPPETQVPSHEIRPKARPRVTSKMAENCTKKAAFSAFWQFCEQLKLSKLLNSGCGKIDSRRLHPPYLSCLFSPAC
jgi:hypothetical protein